MITVDSLNVVDVDLALNLMNGYEQIYFRVIQTFLENHGCLVENLEKCLEKDLDEARRLVHSCKGISKNIGSLPLYEVSEAFEQAIVNRNSNLINFYYIKFKAIFNQVLQDLRKIQSANI